MDKFFLKSKTIIGILVIAVVSLAPEIGISFSSDDGVFVNQLVDQIVQTAGLVVAAYGRFVADGRLSIS